MGGNDGGDVAVAVAANAVPGGGGGGGGERRGSMVIRVQMLDDSISLFQVQNKAPSRILFDQICKQLHLLEVDYFGLEYSDLSNVTYWLDLDKQMNHQVGLPSRDPFLRFCVKFYPPDPPSQIEEEYTRYLFGLQIKRDLASGALQCNDNTAALMASYIVQAECGDYVVEDYPDHTYLSSYKFIPQQDDELERKIMENHKKHIGQSPAEADLNLLETARRCELYGTKLHTSKDHEGVPLNLAVAHMGVVVFQNYTRINTFSWAKIRKLSFKRKKFLIKLHPEGYGYYKDTVEFYFEDRNQCKNFWKKCVEHHTFFRCSRSSYGAKDRERKRILSRGSSFRYSGKTQKQMQEYVRENFVKRQSFQRHVRHLHSSMGNVGQSMSAQPLLPIGDNGVASPSYMASPMSIESTTMPATSPSNEGYQSTFANSLTSQHEMMNSDSPAMPVYHSEAGGDVSTAPAVKSPYAFSPSAPNTHADKLLDNRAAYNSLSREDSVDYDVSSPLARMESLRRDAGAETDTEVTVGSRKRRYPTERPYFIAKEILMTERTYKKDLEILNVWFRDEVAKETESGNTLLPEEMLSLLFLHLDPIYEVHCGLLKEIEQRMANWEGRNGSAGGSDCKKIGDVLLHAFDLAAVDHYGRYLEEHLRIMSLLEQALSDPEHAAFQQLFKDFESQKVCYLPLTSLILKPLHRLLHYELLVERLLRSYNSSHPDYQSANMAMIKLQTIIRKMANRIHESENFIKMAEIQRDLGSSYEAGLLSVPGREFVREGCLRKLSRKGYQQRMFFLFSDLLLYSNRTTNPTLHFRVHGALPVRELSVLDSEARMEADHCFNIYDGKKALLVAAANQEEKIQWMEDIAEAAQTARAASDPAMTNGSQNKFMSMKSISGSEDCLDRSNNDQTLPSTSSNQRTNSSVHVCWHRATTLAKKEFHLSLQTMLSGYLLRKFKNSNGWQKLWVVFTNSCLYFFKTFQDDFPLASLPLLGYEVQKPNAEDAIQKDFVFKLRFKNHVYFFRAESQYTFDRWIEVLGTATSVSEEFDSTPNDFGQNGAGEALEEEEGEYTAY